MRRLLDAGPDATVRIHTFQHPDAWALALSTGTLSGSAAHADPDYAEQYEWMRDRMRELVPGYGGGFPVWAYLARPNMRRHPYGEPRVLVAADVPRRRMVLSDLDRWVEALNRVHLADDGDGMRLLEDDGTQTWDGERGITPAMRDSWLAVLDLDADAWPAAKRAYWGRAASVQACIEWIRLDEVAWASTVRGRLGRVGAVDDDGPPPPR